MEKIAGVQSSMPDNLLIDDTCRIIESARDYAYRAVNTALTIRNWKLGERIYREHLDDNGRAEYGKGFDFSSLYQYVKFYRCFPEILDAVSPKSGNVDAVSTKLLPWTLYRELIRVEDGVARKWYAIRDSAKAAYTAAIMLTHVTEVHRFESTPIDEWKDAVIGEVLTNKLNKLKKSNPEAFFYWWQVDKVLAPKSNE